MGAKEKPGWQLYAYFEPPKNVSDMQQDDICIEGLAQEAHGFDVEKFKEAEKTMIQEIQTHFVTVLVKSLQLPKELTDLLNK
jgi:hypothetical protein